MADLKEKLLTGVDDESFGCTSVFGVKNEKVDAVSFFGVTAAAVAPCVGVGAPKVNPVVGVLAAFKLLKNEAVAGSGLEGLGAGVVEVLAANGEVANIENGEFLTSEVAAALATTDLAGGAVVEAVDGLGLTEMVGVPRMDGLMGAAVDFGVVACEVAAWLMGVSENCGASKLGAAGLCAGDCVNGIC